MVNDILKAKADLYAHIAYKLAKKLPKDEMFGLTSQFRCASLSVPLNIIEGHARKPTKADR